MGNKWWPGILKSWTHTCGKQNYPETCAASYDNLITYEFPSGLWGGFCIFCFGRVVFFSGAFSPFLSELVRHKFCFATHCKWLHYFPITKKKKGNHKSNIAAVSILDF